jgi:hypothetical protein
LSGDELTIRTTLFGTALALASLAVSQANLRQAVLIYALFIAAAISLLASIFWPLLSKQVAMLGKATALISLSWKISFLFRAISVLSLLVAVYEVVRLADGHGVINGNSATAPSAVNSIIIDTETDVAKAFKGDFAKTSMRVLTNIDFNQVDGDRTTHAKQELVIDFESNTEFLAFFIPYGDLSYSICVNIANNYKTMLAESRKLAITRQTGGELAVFDSKSLVFTNVIYLYVEKSLTLEQLGALQKLYRERGLSVQFKNFGNVKIEEAK